MPVYEYVCTVCGHPIEVMHSFTAEGPKVCTQCGGAMRKALSTPAIVFKGSGWAKKDHRDKVHASSKATPAVPATGGGDAAAGDAATATTAAPDGGGAVTPATSTTSATPAASASSGAASPAPAKASKGAPASAD